MKFHALIEGAGKTAAGIEVPAEVVTALGQTKRPPVRVTINGYTYRSTVATVGGRFMVGVSNEVRANAGVAAGDEVEVEMVLDTAPREVAVPPSWPRSWPPTPRRAGRSRRCRTASSAFWSIPSRTRRQPRRATETSPRRLPPCAEARAGMLRA